jgi:alanine racemase
MITNHRPAYVEVNLSSIQKNLKTFQQLLNQEAQIMAIVKANAYGHGAVKVAQAALDAGAQWLGVAIFQEAAELRAAGLKAPILVLGYCLPEDYSYMIEKGIRLTISTLEQGLAYAQAAAKLEIKAPVHIKIDTGMGRLGFQPNSQSIEQILQLAKEPYLNLEGIFTHPAQADAADPASCQAQVTLFNRVLTELAAQGCIIPMAHCANTAAAMRLPVAQKKFVRIGIGLYGLYPSAEAKKWKVDLAEAISVKSNLVFIKSVDVGTAIGYGHTWQATRPSLIGTVPLGYADGISRQLSNRGSVLVRGRRAPIIGRICMDQLMVDLTEVPNAELGDEVVLIGNQGNQKIAVDEVAELMDTINYEVVCLLSQRLPRHYCY